ncbi:phage holin, LLH family [Limosilactobacillus fermentum]|uniref:phage holin, LLH family n=1 Tax=Limosilactobacillus fermentum TaxID=1613 RepID=UPI0032661679
MKTVNDLVEWLIQSGALVAIVLFAWKFVKPWLDAKASHANTERAKASWILLEQIANISVTALVSQNMTGKDKFDLAVKHVMQAMHSHGFEVSQAVVEDVVQTAYEQSSLTPTVVPGNDSQPAQGSVVAIDPKEAK